MNKGPHIYKDGSKYDGEWKDNKRHGYGIWIRPDEMRFEGYWENDKPNGHGTLTLPSGKKYVGEWKNGKRHGLGIEINSDGTKRFGEWVDGIISQELNSTAVFEKKRSEVKEKRQAFDENNTKAFCTKCGQIMKLGELYCSQCGAPIKTSRTYSGITQNIKKIYWIAGTLVILLILYIIVTQIYQTARSPYASLTLGAISEYSVVYNYQNRRQVYTMTISIEDEEFINEKKYFKQVTNLMGMQEVAYLRVEKDGIYAIEEPYLHYPEYLHYPLPFSVGNSWIVNSPRGTLHYTIESRENIDIEDQSYRNCYKLVFYGEIDLVNVEGFEYHHLDIGMVKGYMVMKDLDITSEFVLKNYSF